MSQLQENKNKELKQKKLKVYTSIPVFTLKGKHKVKDKNGYDINVETLFTIEFKNNYPRFIVNKDINNWDSEYWDRTISIPLQPTMLSMFADMILLTLNSKRKHTLICKNIDYEQPERREIIVSGYIDIEYIDNKIKLTVVDGKQPDEKYEFYLTYDKMWFEVKVNDNDYEGDIDHLFAQTYANQLKQISNEYMVIFAYHNNTTIDLKEQHNNHRREK